MIATPAPATEYTLEALLALAEDAGVTNLFIEEMARLMPPRALQYARDANDRIRVILDTGQANASAILWGNNNAEPSWYSSGAPNAMDAREIERTQTQIRFMSQRARWTIV